jgi:hypothetical protein
LGRLLPSADLDKAVADGFSGPSWSIDGTAVYVDHGTANSTGALKAFMDMSAEISARQSKEVPVLSKIPILSSMFRLEVAPPLAGASVFELIPSSAILRPVRFRGPWASRTSEVEPFQSRSHTAHIQLGTSRGASNSLWISPPKDAKNVDQAVLVSGNAGQAWIAPANLYVAFLTDGALFVKSIERKR